MHELSIAQSILDTVRTNLRDKKTVIVKKIHISLGVLSGVEKESLQFNFDLIPKDKLFKNVKLLIKENVLEVYCPKCKQKTKIKNSFVLKCAHCGNLTSDIVKGRELTVDKIEI
ncbi:MAG TPA: hydrogenase maturation nickel metallochaperone HypA [Candidatus Methanoperedens sp.]|nr:hydrogenase maturation nickel metallochaperone HypA [Candidatus Methanoperedens sp.]